MNIKKTLLTLIFIVLSYSICFAQEKVPNIIPIPQHWQWQNGSTSLTQLHAIILGKGANQADRFTAEQIQEVLSRQFHVHARILTESGNLNAEHAILIGNPAQSGLVRTYVTLSELSARMDTAGYILKIENNRVIIAAQSARGRFYGAMSLKQMLQADSGSTLRDISITDYPAMKFRGVSDDMSRGQVSTQKNLEKIIRFMAEYKMNTYMPYIEDIFQFKQYPGIGKNRGAFTLKEVQILQQYAHKYHVQIIPIFETLGHQENILNNKKFVKYAEFPGAASFDTQNKAADRFLDQLLSDIVPAFHSKYFSMGGDESFAVGLGSSKAAVQRYGLSTVNADYYRKVYDFIRKYHKTVIMYGDMLLRNPLTISEIPKHMIIMDWHYGASDNFSSTEEFSNAHQPFIASPGISDWSMIYPLQSNAWINMYHFTLQGYQRGALGSITSSWGDDGGPNLRELNYRGYAYEAECSWNPTKADEGTIDTRFNKIFFGTNDPRLLTLQSQLISLAGEFSYRDVWRQPFDRLENRSLAQAMNVYRGGRYALTMINSMDSAIPRHAAMLNYYSFVARLSQWFGNSLLFARWMHTTAELNITPQSRKPYDTKGIRWGENLENNIDSLRHEYDQLWLSTNRKDNLDLIDTLFQYQKVYLENIIDGLKQNEWDTSFKIPSDFISAFGASKTNPIPGVFLRKEFTLNEHAPIQHAWIQVIGNTDVHYWVNGHEVYHNYAKRQGSLRIDLNRSKYFDIAHLLKSGEKNVIAVKVQNYEDQPAAANVYVKIEYANGATKTILSDPYWKSCTHEEKGWTQTGFDDTDWLPVSVVNGFTVYKPEFKYGLPSFIPL